VTDYASWCTAKRDMKPEPVGFDVSTTVISDKLFGFQRELVRWALKLGKAALFCECGLGKTPMQLEWADRVAQHTQGPVLILAPLAVSQQTVREGEKFDVPVRYAGDQSEVKSHVVITNYERLHKFDSSAFAGVVLDESSCIKQFMGSRKREIFEAFAKTPFKLACTATPAPNDHMELGQHCEFLDVLTSHEMLARWFINDTTSFGTYRLKGHAARSFWEWVCSWARCVGRPSDLGAYPDDGYALPQLQLFRHIVDAGAAPQDDGDLFGMAQLSATAIHKEKRRTVSARAAKLREVIEAEPNEPWIIWCETDYEEDAVLEELPDVVPIRGSLSLEEKESRLSGFTEGRIRRISTKASLACLGLNWQHCARMAFAGPTFSFERYYQAIRRCWRFGQSRPVHVHVVMADTETGVWDVLQTKQEDHRRMQAEMFAAARRAVEQHDNAAELYRPTGAWKLADWVATR
jgi:hypothetical protein